MVVNVSIATDSDHLIGRINPLVAFITPTEIAILGGSTKSEKLGNGYIFNVENNTMKKAFETDFKFDTQNNQCVTTNNGQVAGLVEDQEKKVHVVTYNKGNYSLK